MKLLSTDLIFSNITDVIVNYVETSITTVTQNELVDELQYNVRLYE